MANGYGRMDAGYPTSPNAPPNRARAMSGEPPLRYNLAAQPAISETIQQNISKGDLPPEILDEIANRVFQQLRSTHLDVPLTTSQPPPPPPPLYNNQTGSSPSTYSTSSPPTAARNVYTPPSPDRNLDDPTYGSPPKTYDTDSNAPVPEKRGCSPSIKQTKDSGNREGRPKPPTRISTSQEETTLEKIWGPLFDSSGRSTQRLGQFLRGLATHLIEDYEPVKSLVITPDKMQKFYADTKLSVELYEWQDVFDDHTSSISRMYRELEAQHHLVQDTLEQRPDIPGLTPSGFERWATLMILAHPDSEFERLQKAVLDMPISNPDDKRERFPKELSRRLFPRVPSITIRQRVEMAMSTHCGITVPVTSTEQSPPDIPRSGSVPINTTTPLERERQPYSGNPSEVSDDELPAARPLERERQPYSSQPGQGRTYDDSTPKPGPPPASMGRSRAESMSSRARPQSVNLGTQRPPVDYGAESSFPRHCGTPLTATNIPPRTGRHHSPSIGLNTPGDFRRSEGDIFGSNSFPGGHAYPPPPSYNPASRGGNIPAGSGYIPPAEDEYYRGRPSASGTPGYDYNNMGQGYPSYR